MMAAANDRPLLVVHDEEQGHLVYDLFLFLQQHGEDGEALACFPLPIAHFPAALGCRALAVSGGAVLGAFYDLWEDTIIHDTSIKSGGYVRWPKLRYFTESREMGRGYGDAPALLPVGDGTTVIRMDRVLFDGHYAFEALRLVPGGGCHSAVPLPKPPISYQDGGEELVWVSAYFAIGTRVWVSMACKGTFSFDAGGSGAWRKEGSWELPFDGRALHVPELGAVVGLAADTRLLCAYDFVPGGAPPVMRHEWKETACSEECIYAATTGDHQQQQQQLPSMARDVPSLAYLGDGRFCICRPMSVMEPAPYGPPMSYNAASFVVVVLRRSPAASGELELVRRGKTTYMCCRKGQMSYVGFIQPAT